MKFCYSRNPRASSALQDCLAVQHAKWIAHRLYRGLGPHRDSSAGFLPPQAPAPFSRHPGKGKQRGALRRFDRMFDSQTSKVGSAVSTGSQFDQTPASQFSPVSPPYSQFSNTEKFRLFELGSVETKKIRFLSGFGGTEHKPTFRTICSTSSQM